MEMITISKEQYKRFLYCEACVTKAFETAKKQIKSLDAIFLLDNVLLCEFFPEEYEEVIKKTEAEFVEDDF